jgi:primosomal protein N'
MPSPRRVSIRRILCGRCNHLNPGGRLTCERCRSSLSLSCCHCGHRDSTVLNLCPECGQPLRGSRGTGWNTVLPSSRRAVPSFSLVVVVALLIFVFVAAY